MGYLRKELSLLGGTILFMNIVIGAGLLSLPGLVYMQVGAWALLSWVFTGLVSLPLLMVFIYLGKNYPDSGGIAHYALRAFGIKGQQIAAFIFLGAVCFGLPSIALTGAYYIDAIFPYKPHAYAVLLIIFSTSLHMFSNRGIAKILSIIGSSVIVILFVLIGISVFGINMNNLTATLTPHSPISLLNLSSILSPFMMIFFAFTGWEIGAHVSEEFKNAKRDFPLAMIVSYILTLLLYGVIAWIVQTAKIGTHFETPFVEITGYVLGSKGRYFVSFVAVVLIVANLFSALWGVSRLVFSLARDEIFPTFLAKTRDGVPLYAVISVLLMLLSITLISASGFFELKKMLAIAGQNFLILYGIAALCLFKLTTNKWLKTLSIGVCALIIFILYLAGVSLFYPLLLTILAIFNSILQQRARAVGRNSGLPRIAPNGEKEQNQ